MYTIQNCNEDSIDHADDNDHADDDNNDDVT